MRAAIALAMVAITAPVFVPSATARTAAGASDQGAYLHLRVLDQKLFGIGWRLASANAAFCDRRGPALGVLWHDLSNYSDPEGAARALGTVGPIVVQAVAAGSPAADARLDVADTLIGIGLDESREGDGEIDLAPVADTFPRTRPSWQRLVDVQAALDEVMRRDGEIVLQWLDPSGRVLIRTTLEPVPACLTRFEVSGIGERAVADGERVVFGDRFPGFDWPDEEFAAAVAHEMAHNLLGHRDWLERTGRSRANIRRTEDEADRLAPWLLANAGYDPAAAVRFMRRWGPDHGGGLFRKRTHAGWDERAAAIERELPLIGAARTRDGTADWSRGFRRADGS